VDGEVVGYGGFFKSVIFNNATKEGTVMGKMEILSMRLHDFKHSSLVFYRRLWYIFRVFLLEKPRGLDFHLRNKKLKIKSGGRNQGYAITPESHLKQIFSALEITNKNNFIDIGCGKRFCINQGG
jgi:hypothetical protein